MAGSRFWCQVRRLNAYCSASDLKNLLWGLLQCNIGGQIRAETAVI